MSNVDVNKIVGSSFEDMTVSEMVNVQGSGDIEVRSPSTPACAIASAALTFNITLTVVKSLKTNC